MHKRLALWGAIPLFLSSCHRDTPVLAITFDDLPAHGELPPGVSRNAVARSILASLKAAHMPPVWGFVNGVREIDDPASIGVLSAWRSAGFSLGNHTWSHMDLNDHSLRAWEADVQANEPLLQSHMRGRDWRWLRFPDLAEGETSTKRTATRVYLARHHYRVAAVTISFRDYAFNAPYAKCLVKKDLVTIVELEKLYLNAAQIATARARSMAHTLYGRDIPYVLLMHLGAFDAHMLPRLISQYRSEGFSFTTLEQAERDPFYKADTLVEGGMTSDTLDAAFASRGRTAPNLALGLDKLESACR